MEIRKFFIFIFIFILLLESGRFFRAPTSPKTKSENESNTLLLFLKDIKTEFESSSKDASEFEEKYGFLIETDSQVNEICQNGYFCQDNSYNVIGKTNSEVKFPGLHLTIYPG